MDFSLDHLPAGSKVLGGKYHLLHTLGSGITSKVKLATKLDTGVQCAVKVHKNPSQNDVESLSKEIEILQNIPHKHLINLIDFIEQSTVQVKHSDGSLTDHSTVYFVVVLELANGGEMIQHLLAGGALEEEQGRFYFRQLFDAMSHLHSNNIVHRDLKPDNVLFDENFNLKLADFGFAGSSATKADGKFSTYCGTQAYMAPEILALNSGSNSHYDGFAADVFSAGVILFVMVRGIPPFFKAETDDRYFKIIKMERWDLYWRQHMKNVPTDMDEDLKEML
jgi:serine/threonine protein kinase